MTNKLEKLLKTSINSGGKVFIISDSAMFRDFQDKHNYLSDLPPDLKYTYELELAKLVDRFYAIDNEFIRINSELQKRHKTYKEHHSLWRKDRDDFTQKVIRDIKTYRTKKEVN